MAAFLGGIGAFLGGFGVSLPTPGLSSLSLSSRSLPTPGLSLSLDGGREEEEDSPSIPQGFSAPDEIGDSADDAGCSRGKEMGEERKW